jgi:hypothetical protein
MRRRVNFVKEQPANASHHRGSALGWNLFRHPLRQVRMAWLEEESL